MRDEGTLRQSSRPSHSTRTAFDATYECTASASSPSTSAFPSRGALTWPRSPRAAPYNNPVFTINSRKPSVAQKALHCSSRNQRLFQLFLGPSSSYLDPHKVAPILRGLPSGSHQAGAAPSSHAASCFAGRQLTAFARQHADRHACHRVRRGATLLHGGWPRCAPGRAPVAAEPAAEQRAAGFGCKSAGRAGGLPEGETQPELCRYILPCQHPSLGRNAAAMQRATRRTMSAVGRRMGMTACRC